MKKFLVSILLGAAILTSGVSTSYAKTVSYTTESKLLDACSGDSNSIVSPLSLNQALGMVGNGATGKTAKEFKKYFGVSQSSYNKYSKNLINNKSGELKVANSVWLTNDTNYKLKKSFNSVLKKNYGVSCKRVAFGTQSGTDKINKWVSDNTGGMIPNMLKNTSASTRLSLVNAIYFESEWGINFDKESTRTTKFSNLNGKSSTVDYMNGETSYFLENKKAYGVVKPYKNARYEFVAILPKSKGDFNVSDLEVESLLKSKKEMKTYFGLPKFEFEVKNDLGSVLKNKLGFKTALSDNAEFGNILSSGQKLHIDKVMQKVKIKVDENGTKAAASTIIDMVDGAVAIEEKFKRIDFNRPFAFMILDKDTDSVLFYGKVMNL